MQIEGLGRLEFGNNAPQAAIGKKDIYWVLHFDFNLMLPEQEAEMVLFG